MLILLFDLCNWCLDVSFFPVQNKSCILLLKKNSWVEVFGYYDLVGENNYSSLLFWSCSVRTFSSFWHLQYSCSPSNHLVLLAEHRLILDCTTVVSAYFFLLKVWLNLSGWGWFLLLLCSRHILLRNGNWLHWCLHDLAIRLSSNILVKLYLMRSTHQIYRYIFHHSRWRWPF